MFSISKNFHFAAAHYLPEVPDGHPCQRLHGHNYVVTIILASETLDGYGFVLDYGELRFVRNWLNDHFDHRLLNECGVENPTAELLAKYIYENALPADWRDLVESVTVCETPDTSATYWPTPAQEVDDGTEQER